MHLFRMAIWARTGLKLAGVLLALLGLIYIALFFIVRAEQFRAWAETELSTRSGLSVRLGSLQLSFPFRIVARAMEISKPGEFSLTADRLTATLNPLDWRSGAVHRLTLDGPALRLNIERLTPAQQDHGAPVALRHLTVRGGSIVLTRGESKLLELPRIDLQAENINLGAQAGMSLRADVPPLNGVADLLIKGRAQELTIELIIRQKLTAGRLSGADAPSARPETMRLHANVRAPEKQKAEALIDASFAGLRAGKSIFTGTLAARVDIDPAFTAATVAGRATLADFPGAVAPAAQALANGNAELSFAGAVSIPEKKLTLSSVRLDSRLGNASGTGVLLFDPQAKVSSAELVWRGAPLNDLKTLLPAPFNGWNYEGRARLEARVRGPWDTLHASGSLHSEDAQVRAENIKAANLNIVVPFEWTPAAASVKQARIDAAKLDYSAANHWQFAAERLRTSASLDFRPGEPLILDARFETAGAKFMSPDNTRLGENLRLTGSFQLTPRPAKNSLTLTGKVSADSGEVLWGSFFNDLKTPKPALDVDADYFSTDDRLDCRRCNLKLANVGDVETTGSIERLTQSPELRLQAHSANFLPGAFFESFLRENFNRQFPVLDRLAAGGRLAFQTRLSGSLENLTVSGDLSLKEGELRAKSNDWAIGPIALNLPFRVSWSETATAGREQRRNGTLAIERIRFGQQVAGPIGASVSLFDNELRFQKAIHVKVFGGEIVVRDLFWRDVISQPKQFSFSLDAERLQLEELTEALGWPRFSGTLTGSIPQVQSTVTALKSNGEIQAELFGGRLRMSKLEIDNPFSSLPAVRLDATLANIQLEQLSRTFAFGQISGILEGTVADLVITNGQPAQFAADLHSVDRGTEQRISVEALNKITVLSSGQSAGALYGGLAGLFDSFRYSKLGFKAILKNDRLTLRGVETRGDQEYLVVGTFLPPTVNIVSHTQTIGFSELMRRLERIKADKPEAP